MQDVWGKELDGENAVKRNIYTMVVDHANSDVSEEKVEKALAQITSILSELEKTDGVERADYDFDMWEDVTGEYNK